MMRDLWIRFNRWMDRLEGREVSKFLHEWVAEQKQKGLKDHEIAANMGYDLCDCTKPPQIMLYVHTQSANVCPLCKKASPYIKDRALSVIRPERADSNAGSSRGTVTRGANISI